MSLACPAVSSARCARSNLFRQLGFRLTNEVLIEVAMWKAHPGAYRSAQARTFSLAGCFFQYPAISWARSFQSTVGRKQPDGGMEGAPCWLSIGTSEAAPADSAPAIDLSRAPGTLGGWPLDMIQGAIRQRKTP